MNRHSERGSGATIDWRREAIAGATIFAVLVPSALAYSSIVGVTPTVGLIGVPLALLAYACAGGSKVVVVGADAAVSVMVASSVTSVAPTDDQYLSAVLLLSVLVGVIFLLFRLLRLGWIADVIPRPVLTGFVQGLVWTTIVGQLPALLGLTVDRSSGNMFVQLWYTVAAFGTVHAMTAVVGVLSLTVLVGFRRLLPRWPGALIVLVGSGLAYLLLNLGSRGVSAVGAPEGSLINTRLALPDQLSSWSGLLPAALAIVVLAFTEHLGCTQMAAQARGERVDPNRELLGLGVANLAVGFGSSFAVTGALSKTSVAIESGARTKVAGLFTAGLALAAALTLRPMFAYLANAVLASVVVWAMLGMIDIAYFRWLARVERWEFAVSLVAFFGVMVLGVMPAVVVATVLALAILARTISRPKLNMLGVTRHTDSGTPAWVEAEECPDAVLPDDVRVVRIAGPLVFLNGRFVAEQLRRHLAATRLDDTAHAGLVVDCAEISAIDTTGQQAIVGVLDEAAACGVDIAFCDFDSTVWGNVQRSIDAGGKYRIHRYQTVSDAVDALRSAHR